MGYIYHDYIQEHVTTHGVMNRCSILLRHLHLVTELSILVGIAELTVPICFHLLPLPARIKCTYKVTVKLFGHSQSVPANCRDARKVF